MNPAAWWRRRRTVRAWRDAGRRFVLKAFAADNIPESDRYLFAAQRCFQRADRIRKGGRW